MRTNFDVTYDNRSFESMSYHVNMLLSEKAALEDPVALDLMVHGYKANTHCKRTSTIALRLDMQMAPLVRTFAEAVLADRLMEIRDELAQVRSDMRKLLRR